MSAAVMGTPYSPPSPPATSSSATMSPTMSPGYPDRPIRPLPKKSLRDRLSLEAADSISYPPAPQSTTPFYIPYSESMAQRNGTTIKSALREIDKAIYQTQEQVEQDDKGAYQFRGNELNSEDEDDVGIIRRYQDYQRQGNGSLNGYGHGQENLSHSIGSSNDSADGYDSFENTNNKKKRKIPTSGAMTAHASLSASLTQDLANLGISNEGEDVIDRADNGVSHYYSGSVASGTGISGAGRGRYGRSGRRDATGRIPLSTSISGSSWSNGRAPVGRKLSTPSKEPVNGDRGIISQAIADAATASLPTMSKQQEHLTTPSQQRHSRKSNSPNTQFTFTYESDTSNKPIWPGDPSHMISRPPYPSQSAPPLPPGYNNRTHGTQTSPPMPAQPGQGSQGHPDDPPSRPRKSAAKRYALAAKKRRAQQQQNNYLSPPKPEDFWICEFCEYESIFKKPPVALIKKYEQKDEKERERLAEKRRLLEKAKHKGRKGKKGNKNPGKGTANGNQPAQATQPPHDPTGANPPPHHHHPEDDYYGDGYDEPGPTPAPSPELSSRIPRPINRAPRQTIRPEDSQRIPQPPQSQAAQRV